VSRREREARLLDAVRVGAVAQVLAAVVEAKGVGRRGAAHVGVAYLVEVRPQRTDVVLCCKLMDRHLRFGGFGARGFWDVWSSVSHA
jgi:hypothetical protein